LLLGDKVSSLIFGGVLIESRKPLSTYLLELRLFF